MPERDFPKGHPAASDYNGEPYTPPRSPYLEEFAPGHPARNGKNIQPVDTPDGMRKLFNTHSQNLQELAAIGSLPPVIDPDTGEKVPLTTEQIAHIYAVRKGLPREQQVMVTDRYHLTPMPAVATEPAVAPMTAEDQARQYFIDLGYSPERANELLEGYGVPQVISNLTKDAHR
jgi:hypothetical protein